jgi:flavodoxin
MKRFKRFIEDIKLKKKVWADIKLSDLDKKTRNMLWDMYSDTYQSIGLHIADANKLTSKYKVCWLIDNDNDDNIDAFIIYKDTKFGKKIALLGSDGEKNNKKVLLNKTIGLLKTKGWFCEASHKFYDILISKKIKIIDDYDLIKKIVGKSFVEELDNGQYKRKLGTLGIIKKTLLGII